ncbi:MAG: hypothetical protein LBU12_04710 [Deltaproteobacteria bacterium]|jgi:type II secretory pathway predicted ATPase ExeA|nr:hypothetical protein [Deltaproteobacteria bacterium]
MDYEDFFALRERPFKAQLEAKFFWRGPAFNELCRVLSGRPQPPVLRLKGPEGVGVSTVVRRLPQALRTTARVAPILNSTYRLDDILAETLNFLGLGFKCLPAAPEESLLAIYQNAVNQLTAEGLGLTLAVDEAHRLSPDTLADLVALVVLEPHWVGRTTLLLAGPTEAVWPPLPPPAHEPAEMELGPLDAPQTADYVRHRLKAAGASRAVFSAEAAAALHKLSGGRPAAVNALAERALMTAWAASRKEVSAAHVQQAKAGLDRPLQIGAGAAKAAGARRRERPKRGPAWLPLAVAALAVATLTWALWPKAEAPPAASQATEAQAAPAVPGPSTTPAAGPALPEEAGLALPTPPPSLLRLPRNSLALVVDHSRNLARLWQGGPEAPGLKAELVAPEFKAPGLYLVGRPRSRTPLIFQYPPAKETPKSAGERLWRQVETMLPQDLLPLMAGESPSLAKGVPTGLDRILAAKVSSWTGAQKRKRADDLARLYADSFVFYEPGRKPLTISRKNFLAALEAETRASGEVELAVSEPLIMLDPRDHGRAWAVFNLKYDSKLRHDTGLRTLIFEKGLLDGDWLITAELWLKEEALKN